jgi:hypothetical protein
VAAEPISLSILTSRTFRNTRFGWWLLTSKTGRIPRTAAWSWRNC